jgi:hypothetical protein
MSMTEQGRMGWIIGLFVVVFGLTGVAIYFVQQNQRLQVTLTDARTALTVAQEQKTEAEERANVPAVASAIALLPEQAKSVLREVTEIAPGVYRVWRSAPTGTANAVQHEWWRIETQGKKAVNVDSVVTEGAGEPGVLRSKDARGRELLSYSLFTKSEELAPHYMQVWTATGELESVLDSWGTQARVRVAGQTEAITLRLTAADGVSCTASSKTIPLSSLEIMRAQGAATTVAVAPPILMSCMDGAPVGSPWTMLLNTAAAAENTQTPGATDVWRFPLDSVGERDRYLEINKSFEVPTLFVR